MRVAVRRSLLNVCRCVLGAGRSLLGICVSVLGVGVVWQEDVCVSVLGVDLFGCLCVCFGCRSRLVSVGPKKQTHKHPRV